MILTEEQQAQLLKGETVVVGSTEAIVISSPGDPGHPQYISRVPGMFPLTQEKPGVFLDRRSKRGYKYPWQ